MLVFGVALLFVCLLWIVVVCVRCLLLFAVTGLVCSCRCMLFVVVVCCGVSLLSLFGGC